MTDRQNTRLQLAEAKRWHYSKYDKPRFYKRWWYGLRDWLAEKTCDCETMRGDGAIWFKWRFFGPGMEHELTRETREKQAEVMERAREKYKDLDFTEMLRTGKTSFPVKIKLTDKKKPVTK